MACGTGANLDMEITLIEKNGKRHELTMAGDHPVSSFTLRELCARFFLFSPLNEITKPVPGAQFKPDFVIGPLDW